VSSVVKFGGKCQNVGQKVAAYDQTTLLHSYFLLFYKKTVIVAIAYPCGLVPQYKV